MRPLIVVLHERSERVLAGAARFWDLPNAGDAAELVGILYPILTDAWQLALGIERIGPLAHPILTTLAHHRTPLDPDTLAGVLGADESSVLATARQLYIAGILASESSEHGIRLFLANELIRLVLRLEHERSEPLPSDTPLSTLLERLTDHELLELAERYGMPVVPTVTTRQEALTFLLTRMSRPDVLSGVRGQLSPSAQVLLHTLLQERHPVPLQELVERSRGSFAELRSTVSELARWGWIWRTAFRDKLAILLPSMLTTPQDTRDLRPAPVSDAVEPLPATAPPATLADLLLLLARSLAYRSGPMQAETSVTPSPSRATSWYWIDPLDREAYIAYLERAARSLSLLRADGTVDLPRLRSWLQLGFAEQARRLLRIWRSVPDPRERARRHRVLERLQALEKNTWYEWSSLDSEHPLVTDRSLDRLAQELAWLGLISLGWTRARSLVIRTTPWITWILGQGDETPPLRFPLHLRLTGYPEVTLERPSPFAVWLAARLGEPLPLGSGIAWHLTPERIAHYVLQSAQLDGTPPEPEKLARAILRHFEQATDRSLPPGWPESFVALFTQSHPAVVHHAVVIAFSSQTDRDRARDVLERAHWTVFPIGSRELVVTRCEPERRSQLVTTLRRAGFVVDWSGSTRARAKRKRTSTQQRPL
ncbi:hypothetical protein OO015_02665 [Thermomicrobium sp. 4228-Ro]|uniref:hypothetical protein n=1 Tax=Thermomicrobium sp. 4228-Ro TaxID=2993937 RepID=UPI0022493638|nr:hypothetical protein [Thermomicrobium sp. 4228-Ro]MCX2726394.1 hypothetical protein [Thermomicrobium sp. 4228-Ro]